jgi:hypothetical protein
MGAGMSRGNRREVNVSDTNDEDVNIVVLDEGEQIPGAELQIVAEAEVEALMQTLKGEYDTAGTEMDSRNQKLILWRKNMEAWASDAPKSHPFKNSSNVTVPVTQVLTQNLYAMILWCV